MVGEVETHVDGFRRRSANFATLIPLLQSPPQFFQRRIEVIEIDGGADRLGFGALLVAVEAHSKTVFQHDALAQSQQAQSEGGQARFQAVTKIFVIEIDA